MMGGVLCLFVRLTICIACLDVTRERKGLWSPKLAGWKPITLVSRQPILRSKGQRSRSHSIKALLLQLVSYVCICGGRILEQLRSTATQVGGISIISHLAERDHYIDLLFTSFYVIIIVNAFSPATGKRSTKTAVSSDTGFVKLLSIPNINAFLFS